MNLPRKTASDATELLLAELTEAAYQVALLHGFRDSFADVKLDLWNALRNIIERRVPTAPHA